MRSLGVGYAFGIGRFGAFGGPALGGMLIGMNMSLEKLYAIGAAPLVISLIACVIMIRLHDTALNSKDAEPERGAKPAELPVHRSHRFR